MNFELEITKPFNLTNTVKAHGWFQLVPYFWNNDTETLTWTIRDDSGKPATITVNQINDSENSVILNFVPNNHARISQDDIVNRFRYIMNLDLDLEDFYQLCAKHPVISAAPKQGLGRFMRSPSIYQDVFKSICGTNVQWRQAVKMINTIAQLGDPIPGTGYRLFPSPQQVLDAGEGFLKDTGRVGYRSSYLIDLCQRSLQPDDMQERLANMAVTYKELFDYFNGFKGIGKVTARYLCALYGKFDELAIDSLVVSYMSRVYFKGEKATIKQIEEIFDAYGEWKYLVYWTEFLINKGWDPDANG